MEEGERPALSFLLEQFLNKFMERERQRFLKDHEGEGEQTNGFYPRALPSASPWGASTQPQGPQGPLCQAKFFRPALRSYPLVGSGWTRTSDAMLANGYSRAQLERALKNLGLPFSPEALEEALDLIREKLDFYLQDPAAQVISISDWFAIFILHPS